MPAWVTRRRAAGIVLVALLAAGVLAVTGFGRDPDPVATEVHLIEVPGGPGTSGPARLDATLYLPAHTPAPAVLMAHGFGGSKHSVADDAAELARRGFVVLAWTARGFGASTGQIGLNSPDHEVADAHALVDWLAERPEVRTDAPGDPRMGVTGASYGGALALLLAGTDPRVDALAPVITYHDLAQALFPNAARRDPVAPDLGDTPAASAAGEPGVFKREWAGLLFSAGSAGGARQPANRDQPAEPGAAAGARGDGPDPCGRFRAELCAAYRQAATTGEPTEEILRLLRRVSPASVMDRISAPTLLIQGEQDSLFGLDQADATARGLAAAGTPVRVVWYAGGHDAPGGAGGGRDAGAGDGDGPEESTDTGAQSAERPSGSSGSSGESRTQAWLREEVGAWFDHHLAGRGPDPGTGFEYQVRGLFGTRGFGQRIVTAPAYPGLPPPAGTGDPVTRVPLALHGSPQVALRPPGGSPAALSSLPGLNVPPEAVAGAAGLAADPPGQAATFSTTPLPEPVEIAGSAQLRLRVAAVAPPGPAAGEAAREAVLFVKLYDIGPAGAALPGGLVAPIRVGPLPADGSPVEVTVTLAPVVRPVEAGHRLAVAVVTTDRGYAVPSTPARYSVALAGEGVLEVPVVPGEPAPAPLPLAQLAALGGLVFVIGALVVVAAVRRARLDDLDPALAEVPVAVSGLAKRYPGGVVAVKDVSFRAERGQVLGLLGPNGAGKTTVLRMLMGLIRPSAGEVRVFGHRVRAGASVLSRIGCFVEGSGFLPHLSGLENLRLYWAVTGRPLADARLDEVLEVAGLGQAVHRAVATYSQGMRQRLAIAQAMLGTPDVLVLDEPTNGLDPPQIHAMREVLRRYAAGGRTVLVSSHLLGEVELTCSHVVVMHRGRVIAAGSVADVTGATGAGGAGADGSDPGGGAAAGSHRRLEEAFLQLVDDEGAG